MYLGRCTLCCLEGIFHVVFRLPRMRVSVFPVVDILRKLLTPQFEIFKILSLPLARTICYNSIVRLRGGQNRRDIGHDLFHTPGRMMARDRRHAKAESAKGNMYSTEDNCRKGDSMFNTMQKQIRQVVLGAMVATATLTGGASPKKTERSSFVPGQKVSTYQTAKAPLTGRRGTTSPNRTNARSSKQVPAVQKGKGVTGQAVKTASPGSWQTDPMDAPRQKVSIPWMPELKFSNKLATFPVTEPENAEFYRQHEYKKDRRKDNSRDWGRCLEYDMLKLGGAYVPDIFYEKAQLPYAERMAFFDNPEWEKIMSALEEQFGSNIGEKRLFNGQPLILGIQMLCSEMLVYGRPLASLTTETESVREAVDLCGMTQLGYWMDIQKAKNREFKDVIPEGYDAKEAQKQQDHLYNFRLLFDCDDYFKAIGVYAENPIRSDLPYYSKEDFAHLTKEQTDELLDLWGILPPQLKVAPQLDTSKIFEEYLAIKADKTGYMYILNNSHPTNKSQDRLRRAQKLAMEMVIYRRPLALLHAENYTLEQVISACHFYYADKFYRRQQKGKSRTKNMQKEAWTMHDLEAKALMNLGKKYHHSDWVEFGQRMYNEGQEFRGLVQKHNDTSVIQTHIARVTEQPRDDDKKKRPLPQ